MRTAFPKAFAAIFLLTVALRLANGFSPLLGPQDWRQCDTAAVARNFHETGNPITLPQVDWGGPAPRQVEMEFPLYPYMVSKLYSIFGMHDFLGRLLSIAFSGFASIYLFLLVRSTSGERTALWACYFFAILPLLAFYTTNFQPESFFIAATLAGMYHLVKWRAEGGVAHFTASAAAFSLACLLKLVNLHLALPVLFVFHERYGRRALLRAPTWLFAAIVLAPVAAWYAHAHALYLEGGVTFGIWDAGSGKWLNLDFLSYAFARNVIFQYLFIKHFAVFGLPAAFAGYFSPRAGEAESIYDTWLLSTLAATLIAARGNLLHEYYQLPLVTACCFYLGRFFSLHFEKLRLARAYAALVTVFSVLVYSVCLTLQSPDGSEAMKLADAIRKNTRKGEAIIHIENDEPRWVFPDMQPVILYHSDRKGWLTTASAIDAAFVDSKKNAGAAYIVGDRKYFAAPEHSKKLEEVVFRGRKAVYDDGRNFIVRL